MIPSWHADLKRRFPPLGEDAEAHRAEHGAEVQLPFLQVKNPECSFVPIALGTSQYELLHGLGEAIADVVRAMGERVLLIASSDMNHYENDTITRVKDQKAIERILVMDARGLFDVVMNEDISMCGFGPTVAMLTAARRLGAVSTDWSGMPLQGMFRATVSGWWDTPESWCSSFLVPSR